MLLVQGPHPEDKGVEELVCYIPLVSNSFFFSQCNFGAFPPCSFLLALNNGIPVLSLENVASEKESQKGKNKAMPSFSHAAACCGVKTCSKNLI